MVLSRALVVRSGRPCVLERPYDIEAESWIGSGYCEAHIDKIHSTNKARMRKGLFSLSANQQKAICWIVLDEAGET